MTKSHGRKSRARSRSRRQGAAYTAANAGTLHVHASGPSHTDLQPADPGRWGVETVPDQRTAAALIGASIERCAPCRQSLTAKLLEEDPIVLAVTADAAYRLRAAREVEGEVPADGPAQVFFFLAQHARAHGGDARLLLTGVERIPAADRAALLDAALDLWAFYGRQHPGLLHGHGTGGVEGRTETVAVPLDEGGVIRTSPLPRHRPSVTRHPSKENRLRMSENTEDIVGHAESAARSLAEFVTDLKYRGIEYPLEAYRIYSFLTRVAGEMRAALTLLGTSVEGLRDRELLRDETLGEAIQRFTGASVAAEELAGVLGRAYSAVGHLAYREAPSGQEPTVRG
ncbi:hypothetical protein ACFZDJ_54805 [Streptomyces sp. NPDC007896]|uniref:hypothetical protein n=1 Tax=Streptomyces sp. NPDC007896 TaxID=3364784 RepID=UPI0036ED6BD8